MSETAVHIPRAPGIDLWWDRPHDVVVPFHDLLDRTPALASGCFLGWQDLSPVTGAVSTTATEIFLRTIGRIAAITQDAADDQPGDPGIRELALGAVESLRRWLGLTDEQVATLVGIAPRSIPNWRNRGHQPYPATVRRLFEVHNLVAALVRRLGMHETSLWLGQVEGGSSRLDRLRGGGFQTVLSEAAPLLFARPGRRQDADDWDDEEQAPSAPRSDPGVFKGRARGARRGRSGG